ncbi:MAG: hypothetical protein R6U32_03535 [Candidatus Woesearchaeota archaeon]
MPWYIWALAALLVMIGIGIGVYYFFFRNKGGKRPIHEEYIWVGQGEHPLKEKKDDEAGGK